MKFYGRKHELEVLELLGSNKPSLVIITGMRRIGKTELIKRFCRDREFAYFFVDKNKTTSMLMEEFQEELKGIVPIPEYVTFRKPEDLLEFILKMDRDNLIVFDEFQRFQRSDPSFISTFQKMWDLHGNDSRSTIIISGSSMGMIRRIFIESESPLFKRADNIMTLRPFTIGECFGIMEDLGVKDPDDRLDIYLLFGGVIYYYRLMEKYNVGSFDDALNKLVLNDLAPLRNEIMDILIEEFGSEHITYHEILSAMAMGKASKKEIGDMTHIESTSLSPYIYDLRDILGIVESAVPVTEDPGRSKKTRYFLKNNYFRFHYRFLYRNMSDYQIGNFQRIKDLIEKGWSTHRGRLFENLALDHVRRTMSHIYPRIGRYWDRMGNELDIVGMNEDHDIKMVLEVKARKMDLDEAERLISSLEKKVGKIFGDKIKPEIGVVAIEVEGKDSIANSGHPCFDLEDMISN